VFNLVHCLSDTNMIKPNVVERILSCKFDFVFELLVIFMLSQPTIFSLKWTKTVIYFPLDIQYIDICLVNVFESYLTIVVVLFKLFNFPPVIFGCFITPLTCSINTGYNKYSVLNIILVTNNQIQDLIIFSTDYNWTHVGTKVHS